MLDQGDLPEEVAGPERGHAPSLALHHGLPVDDDEELTTGVALLGEHRPGRDLEILGQPRELDEVLLGEALEQRRAPERLDLLVLREQAASSDRIEGCALSCRTFAPGRARLQRSSLARVPIRAKRRMLATRAACAAAVGAAALGGCGGKDRASPGDLRRARARPRADRGGAAGAGAAARAAGRASLPRPRANFTCATLSVPLDRARPAGARLKLAVARERRARAPRGVLVRSRGGPGQAGLPLAPRLRRRLGAALEGYRLVLLDQRGTGERRAALPGAAARARGLRPHPGPRRRRRRLRQSARPPRARRSPRPTRSPTWRTCAARWARARLTLDGVSYGTFVAERYALAHPDRVARLVLDSVVPQDGVDPLYADAMARDRPGAAHGLPRAGAAAPTPSPTCAAVVRRRHDGAALLDTLVALSIGRPRLSALPRLLHDGRARAATPGWTRLVRAVHRAQAVPAPILSQGLHAATLCADLRAPWGGPGAPLAVRRAALERAARRLPAAALGPFDRATATGNGIAATCARLAADPRAPRSPRAAACRASPCCCSPATTTSPRRWPGRGASCAARRSAGSSWRAAHGHSVQSRGARPAGPARAGAVPGRDGPRLTRATPAGSSARAPAISVAAAAGVRSFPLAARTIAMYRPRNSRSRNAF